jgi:TPR repeat protein
MLMIHVECQIDSSASNSFLGVKYYTRTADQGNSHAQVKYTVIRATGDRIPMNLTLALHDYKFAADQGNHVG